MNKRVQEGINAACGNVVEIPLHPIKETGKRPTSLLVHNLAYVLFVGTLFGYTVDGVVLNIKCDKTIPALLMAAEIVIIPEIAVSASPMLNGWINGKRMGSRTIV